MTGLPEETESPDPEFEAELAAQRSTVYGYLLSILGRPEEAADVLQNSSLTAWKKRADFTPGTNFLAWFRRIAFYEAQNHRRKRQKQGETLMFDEELVAAIADRAEEREREFTRHRQLLQFCLEKLPARQRTFVERHYLNDLSVQELAEAEKMKPNAVAQLLFRARASLIACVQTHSHRFRHPHLES